MDNYFSDLDAGKMEEKLYNRTRVLQRMNSDILEMLGDIIEYRDSVSGGHVKRVKSFTNILASQVMNDLPEYGLTDEDVERITAVSALHDVGKMAIPDSILLKPGRLTPEEFEIMKSHTVKGCDILLNAPRDWDADTLRVSREVCRSHHEKWDGKGYPDGLAGDEIPISAQIVSVADCFDALTHERPYKQAYSGQRALSMIFNGECGLFSQKLLCALEACKPRLLANLEDSKAVTPDDVPAVKSTSSLNGLNILLADSSNVIRSVNKEILENEGAHVLEAENASETLDVYKRSSGLDVILIDPVMPDKDGVAVIREIRKLEEGSENRVPIIVLTADKTNARTITSLDAGADDCIGKPLVLVELSGIIVDCLRNRSSDMEKHLEDTVRQATTDIRSGAKNILAYTDRISELSEKVLNNPNYEFGILLCDVDGLKIVNDSYGHSTGNLYIKNCCKILMKNFAHSPVYRVGGNEFAVILQGVDLVNCSAICKEMENDLYLARRESSYQKGKASFTYGLAFYDPNIDFMVGDVYKRADKALYEKKHPVQ